jgi:hypothetical protein
MLLWWQQESLSRGGSGRVGALESDSAHRFFGGAWSFKYFHPVSAYNFENKANNKITELRTILHRESQNS